MQIEYQNLPCSSGRLVGGRALAILAGFGLYALAVSTIPVETSARAGPPPAGSSASWRAAGCHACHSVFGLGGHTGPDLTNVIARTSPDYVRAAVRAGMPGMNPYPHLGQRDLDAIVEYLTRVDQSAAFPPTSLTRDLFGTR